MDTIIVKISEDNIDKKAIATAGEIIRSGGLVAFPTETVYGLGGDALNERAAEKIYKAKGRPSDNPLIAHISNREMLKPLVKSIPKNAEKLMDAFWPGPLTMIFEKSDIVPKGTTGGLDTVAVRFPNHPVAQRLIEAAGTSIAAPSANLSGKPSPTLGEHVVEDLNGRIDMIIDSGMVGMGLESTIIDVTVDPPMILRPGFITYEMAKGVVGEIGIDQAILSKPKEGFKPKAPGMKYRHYAPAADFSIYKGDAKKVAARIVELANDKADKGFKTGIITADQHLKLYQEKLSEEIEVVSLGDLNKPETIANHLFKSLRDFDKDGVEFIFGEAFSQDNIGWAIMNRLTKAAGYNIIDV